MCNHGSAGLRAEESTDIAELDAEKLLAELKYMKQRIEQMEAQLHAQSSRTENKQSANAFIEEKVAARPQAEKDSKVTIPGTKAKIVFGGFVQVDGYYDFGPQTPGPRNGDLISYRSIPLKGTAAGEKENGARLHARATQLNFKSQQDSRLGAVGTYAEFDFLGTVDSSRGNDNLVSNSYEARVRHAYVSVGPLLIGQTWSNFQDLSSNPEMLTYEGVLGRTFIRQAQVRYSKKLTEHMQLLLAIENPESDWSTISGPDTAGSAVADRYPDITAKIVRQGKWGQIAGRALGRWFRADNGSKEDTAFGWGLGLSGSFKGFYGKDNFVYKLIGGDGIGRYMNNNHYQGATLDPDLNIDTLFAWGTALGYQHWWTNSFRSTVSYAYQQVHNNSVVPASLANHSLQMAAGNIIWEFTNKLHFAAGLTWGEREVESGNTGDVLRVMTQTKFHF